MNILINNMHGNISVSLVKLLKDLKSRDIMIIGTDILEYGTFSGSLMVDKYYVSPPMEDEKRFLEFLYSLSCEIKIDILIPSCDAEAVILSKHKNCIPIPYYIADEETVSLFKDKLLSSNYLKEKGFDVPPIITDLRNESKIIFRKRNSVRSQGIYVVDLLKEQYIRNLFNDDYFIQPFIPSASYIVDVMTDKNGMPQLIVPRLNYEIRDYTAYRSKLVNDLELIALTRKICELFYLPGFFNIDFKKYEGKNYFIELNVRYAASGIFSAMGSFNYLEMYLEHFVNNKKLLGFDYYMQKVKWGSIVSRYYEELIDEKGDLIC